jgi:hypothetical protein
LFATASLNAFSNGICGSYGYASISNTWGVLNSYSVYISCSPVITVNYGMPIRRGGSGSSMFNIDVVRYPMWTHPANSK